MTLTAKSRPPQTEQGSHSSRQPVVDLEPASFGFAEGIQSMNAWQRIRSINALTDLIDHAESPAAKADALHSDLRLLAKATRLKKLAR